MNEHSGNTGELELLARRAVACRGWRWMPGMLTTDDLRVVEGGTDYVIGHRSGETKRGGGWFDGESTGLLPDFRDPATIGCVLALVREALGKPVWVRTGAVWIRTGDYGNEVCWRDGPHSISILFPDRDANADSDVSALVAVLEAAP